jgi:eukaryotic-like serine/threonine-protein kinase
MMGGFAPVTTHAHEQTTAAQPECHGSVGVPEPIDDDPPDLHIGSATTELRPGRRVGRYIVRSLLGRGGMGVVYEAIDRKVGRRLALKLVHGHGGGTARTATDRLLREAQALARLNHPNIVALYDFGTTDTGVFIAMEHVRGESLRTWMNGEHSWRDIVGVFVEAGRGLKAAHAAGIVHRDFKPTNVLVGYDRRVKVLDFGLARRRATSAVQSKPQRSQRRPDSTPDNPLLATRLTSGGVIVGTTHYMSPEQLMDLDIGPASDQFSFCVALWEALYGERPYPGETMLQLALAYRDERITPPKRRGVPGTIRRALLRGLQLRPTDRFSSMHQLLEALEQACRRRRTRGEEAGLIVATASLTLAATLWTQWLWERATGAHPSDTTTAIERHDSDRQVVRSRGAGVRELP